MTSKQKMLILVEDIINEHGYPDTIEIHSKNIQKSKITKGKELRYENEIWMCYKNGKKFLVNEVFYYSHCPMVINTIEKFIESLKSEEKFKH